MPADRRHRIARAIDRATMPHTLATSVKRYLKKTSEYEQARAEGRSRAWLEAEALSLGHALAEVVNERLDALDGSAGASGQEGE